MTSANPLRSNLAAAALEAASDPEFIAATTFKKCLASQTGFPAAEALMDAVSDLGGDTAWLHVMPAVFAGKPNTSTARDG